LDLFARLYRDVGSTKHKMIPLSFTGTLVIFIRIPLMNLTIGVQFSNMNMTNKPTYFQYHLMQVTSHWLLLHFIISVTLFF